MSIAINFYKNRSYYDTKYITGDTVQTNAPNALDPVTTYGAWGDYYPIKYSHTVKKPISLTTTTDLVYYSTLYQRQRAVTVTAYSNTWKVTLVMGDGSTSTMGPQVSAGDAVTLHGFAGQTTTCEVHFDCASSTSSYTETDPGYWEGEEYTLPAVSFSGYTQNNYTGRSSSYSTEASPGSTFWSSNLTAWNGPFPFESPTWTSGYSKLIRTLSLDPDPGTGGTNIIYYWDNNGWYSDNSATNTIKLISIPTRTGYSFDGYYVGTGSEQQQVIDDQGKILIESISENAEAYAKWKANTYTVTFDLNNPMTEDDKQPDCDPISKIVTYDSSYGDLPTPSRVGYDFAGWYTNATGGTKISSDIIYKIANDSTIYAHWTKKKYNIKAEIDSDGLISVKVGNSTSGISSTEEVEYWDSVTLVAKLDSHDPGPGSEWAFDSWKLSNSTVSNKASYTIEHVTSSNTYKAYAYMGVKKFILTIKREDESIKGVRFENYPLANEQQMPNVTFGQTIIIHAVPENGNIGYCVFDGWYKDGSLISSDADTAYTVTGNDILIAKGHIEIPRYKISLKNNGCNNTNQNGGVVSITYEDGYGYNSGSKQVNPGETKSFYILRDLSNNSSLKLKVEDIGYGYQFKNWVKGDWSSTDLEWEVITVTQSGTYEANFELWNLDGATWKGYYIFVKTSDKDLPWKIVKEIKIKTEDTGDESDWKLSSKAPSQP